VRAQGAPSLEKLLEMHATAEANGVNVFVGFNKNVAHFARAAVSFYGGGAGADGAEITFVHNNAYRESELPECFERNAGERAFMVWFLGNDGEGGAGRGSGVETEDGETERRRDGETERRRDGETDSNAP
jgi:hypothetical protein